MTDSYMFMPPSRPSLSSKSSGFSNLLVAPPSEWKMRISDLSWRCAMLQLQSEAKLSEPGSGGQNKFAGTAKQDAESHGITKAGGNWWDRLQGKREEGGKIAEGMLEESPRANTKIGTKEDVEAFLYRTERAMERKKELVADILHKVEAGQEVFPFRPHLTKVAKGIGRSYKDLLDWQKATGDRIKEAQEVAKDKELDQCTFQPRPSSIRPILTSETNITKRLWNDAQTRAARQEVLKPLLLVRSESSKNASTLETPRRETPAMSYTQLIKRLANSNSSISKDTAPQPQANQRTFRVNMSSMSARELKQIPGTTHPNVLHKWNSMRTLKHAVPPPHLAAPTNVRAPKLLNFDELVFTHNNPRVHTTSSTTPRKPASHQHDLASFSAPTASSSARTHSIQSEKSKPATRSARAATKAASPSTGVTLIASKVPVCVPRPKKVSSTDHRKSSSTTTTAAYVVRSSSSGPPLRRSEQTLSMPSTRVSIEDTERLKQGLIVTPRSRASDRSLLPRNTVENNLVSAAHCSDTAAIASNTPQFTASMLTSSPQSTTRLSIDEAERMKQGLIVTPRSRVSDRVMKSRNSAEQAQNTTNIPEDLTKTDGRRNIESVTLTSDVKPGSACEGEEQNIFESTDSYAPPFDDKYQNLLHNTAETEEMRDTKSETASNDAKTGSVRHDGEQNIIEPADADAPPIEGKNGILLQDTAETDRIRNAGSVTLSSGAKARSPPQSGEQNKIEPADADAPHIDEKKQIDISTVDDMFANTGNDHYTIVIHKAEKLVSQEREHNQDDDADFLPKAPFIVNGARVVLKRAEAGSDEFMYESHPGLDLFNWANSDDLSSPSMSPLLRAPATKETTIYVSPLFATLSDRIHSAVARGLLVDDEYSDDSYTMAQLFSGGGPAGTSEDGGV